jgi:hypothetical protein
MPAILAQQENENYSPPTEGTSDTLGVADRGGFQAGKSFPVWDPSVGGDLLRSFDT